LLSVQQVVIQDKHSFEVYGYDLLFDSDLKPWLIEVNASPSLTGDVASDYDMKKNVLQDTFDVLDIEGNGTSDGVDKVGGYDLIWHNGPVQSEQRCVHPHAMHHTPCTTRHAPHAMHHTPCDQAIFWLSCVCDHSPEPPTPPSWAATTLGYRKTRSLSNERSDRLQVRREGLAGK
jgi:hypothetical protein